MKKSLRVLSLVLSVVMIMSTLSVLGSAAADPTTGYAVYRNANGTGLTFDDVNTPVYDVDQYASMTLDELDRMLTEENLSLDIYIGTLNLKSVDGTIASVNELFKSVGNLLSLGLLGDANLLSIEAIKNTKRANGDVTVFWDLLDLIGDLNPIVKKYVSGNISLGMLNGLVADYIFDVRQLAVGMLYQVSGMGDTKDSEGNTIKYNYMDDRQGVPSKYLNASNGVLTLGQDVLNNLVIGEWKKLNDLFYSSTNKTSNVVYSEYEFHANTAAGADVSAEAMNLSQYDYYGWVHPDRWVTFGLGDAIRVPKGTSAPAPSYTKVDITKGTNTYDFVEPLLLHAYNNILVPVLNRITKNWLREKAGYVFDAKYTTLYMRDLPEYENADFTEGTAAYTACYNEDGTPKINPQYDYMYGGIAPEGGLNYDDKIFQIFDVNSLVVPDYRVTSGHYFIDDFNRNLITFAKSILKVVPTVKNSAGQAKALTAAPADGDVYTFAWTSDDGTQHYEFDAIYGANSYLMNNVCNALKFILKVTGNEFFGGILENKGLIKTPAEVQAMSNQELLAYILRSVINANVEYIWIDDVQETRSIIGVCYEAVVQLAYQDVPQFTYTRPANATVENLVTKALGILMDVAAYKLNTVLDVNADAPTDANYDPKTNNGLLGYLGDNGNYATSAIKIAAWAISTYVNTNTAGDILNIPGINWAKYNNGGAGITEDAIWSDFDLLLNAIIPIKAATASTSQSKPDNRPWISADIAANAIVSKSFVFNYLVYPICNLDINPLLKLLERNPQGALATESIDKAVVDTLHRIFDGIAPDVFSNQVNTIDAFLQNGLLGSMVSDLLITLTATRTSNDYEDYQTTNGGVITGKGKVLVEFALPIVAMIIGLNGTQKFGQLENYIPETISTADSTTKFYIYNGSSGVNTSYRDPDDSYKRKTDKLYTYLITSATCNVVGTSNTLPVLGVTNNTTRLAAGEKIECSVSGYSAGSMLEMLFRYKVYDETGALLNGGSELQTTNYIYVANTTQGDDEVLRETGLGGMAIQAPAHYYLSGGLGSLENFSFRIKDNKNSGTVTVTNVQIISSPANANANFKNNTWVTLSDKESKIKIDSNGQDGTYVVNPFKVIDKVGRVEYNYQKDADGAYVLDNCDMKIKNGVKTPENGNSYVADGEYVIRTTFNGSTTVDLTVHIYDDFGLPSLLNSAISANRSTLNISQAGIGKWNGYYNAITAAVAFVRQPNSHGGSFQSWIGSSTYSNKYEELYRNLYTQIETIKPFEVGANAQAIYDAVNAKWPYNYTRNTDTNGAIYGTVTGGNANYRVWKEYYQTGYSYIGEKNYVGSTYRAFKKAVENANSLIDREFKYMDVNPEDFAKLTAEEKANVVKAYNEAVENKGSISAVDGIIAIHMVQLQAARLISLGAGNKSKLQAAVTKFGTIASSQGYSNKTWTNYNNAKTFANATMSNANATPEQIVTAMNKLIGAWKSLEVSANYSALQTLITSEKQFIANNVDGWGLAGNAVTGAIDVNGAAEQTTYSEASYTAYLEALKAGEALINDKNAGNDLGLGDQDKIDKAVQDITAAKAALKSADEGDDPDQPGGEASWDINFDAEFQTLIGEAVYAPRLNDEVLEWVMLETVEDEESEYYGYDINGVIQGLPEYFDDGQIQDAFVLDGCYVEVTETMNGFGSGSLAVIKSEADDEVLAIYYLILRGDLNGDGGIDASDDEYFSMYTNGIDGYTYDDGTLPDRYLMAAFDMDGDDWGDTTDYAIFDQYTLMYIDVDQNMGGLVEQ